MGAGYLRYEIGHSRGSGWVMVPQGRLGRLLLPLVVRRRPKGPGRSMDVVRRPVLLWVCRGRSSRRW